MTTIAPQCLSEKCRRPLLAVTEAVPAVWRNHVVAVLPDGTLVRGSYTGGGRVGGLPVVDHGASLWHEACWQVEGLPQDHRGPSPWGPVSRSEEPESNGPPGEAGRAEARSEVAQMLGRDAMGCMPPWAHRYGVGVVDIGELRDYMTFPLRTSDEERERRQHERNRAAGALLGLLLGDALGAGSFRDDDELVMGTGLVRSTCLVQLAFFTLEGFLRGLIRFADKGIGTPVNSVHFALWRWGTLQGLVTTRPTNWPFGDWPDGWLAQLAPMGVRRGNAPATVSALRGGTVTTFAPARNRSAGHHALGRTLPLALLTADWWDLGELAGEVAAVTHGSGEAQQAAAAGTVVVSSALRRHSVADAYDDAARRGIDLEAALRPATAGTAAAALATGLRVARAKPDAGQVLPAVREAAATGGPGAAVFTGALLGAVHGADALPSDIIGRLELGWVAERLAVDALAVEGGAERDACWTTRYPSA